LVSGTVTWFNVIEMVTEHLIRQSLQTIFHRAFLEHCDNDELGLEDGYSVNASE
jgi:hypothetical protein